MSILAPLLKIVNVPDQHIRFFVVGILVTARRADVKRLAILDRPDTLTGQVERFAAVATLNRMAHNIPLTKSLFS
jgi:hypothetical protein